MLSKYFRHAVFTAAALQLATAQKSKIVPQDLQTAFDDQVQVSYDNNAVEGFTDGTTFEKDAVADEPTFAVGDSSGIVPSRRYTVLMLDTTCENARTLHFARTNFKIVFDVVKIESETQPQLEYKAPGTLGEAGDRQYSFLLYIQKAGKEISDLKLPGEGQPFDVKQFQTDNGFNDPQAGLGMEVKLGGQSSCDGAPSGGSPSGGEGSQSSSSPEPESSAPARPSPSSPAAGASSSARGPSSAAQSASSASREASSAALSAAPSQTPVASRPASTPSATPNEPKAPANTPTEATETAENAEPSVTRAPATGGATGPAGGAGAANSTLVQSTRVPGAGGASPTGEQPAQQSTNGAPGLSLGGTGSIGLVSMMVLAGLLV